MKWVDAVFPPFRETERVKPKNMLYVAHETPGWGTSLAVGAQHAVVLLMLVIYTVIAGQEIGLSDGQLRGFIAVEIVAAGIATFLQATRTRFGSGHLIVHNPSPIGMAGFIAVSATYGIGAATGALIVSGIVVLALSRFLPNLRSVFGVAAILSGHCHSTREIAVPEGPPIYTVGGTARTDARNGYGYRLFHVTNDGFQQGFIKTGE